MTNRLPSTTEYPTLVAKVLRPAPDASAVTDLVLVCQRMASAYVRVKTMTTRFDPTRTGLSVDDFAFDAIAEMFRRDERNQFSALAAAFDGAPVGLQSPEAVEQRVRQLVFTAVNRQIYRSYRDTDPSLAKLLRNIKNALKAHPTAAMAPLGGEWMVVPRQAMTLHEHLPSMTPEFLAAELHARVPSTFDLREILSSVVSILSEQTDYSRRYSLTGIALLIRGVYARNVEPDSEETLFDEMTDEELERFLRPALGNVLRNTGRKYLENGKVTERELQVYARALFDSILEKFERGEGEGGSLFDFVIKYDPSITHDDYLEKHRPILEYLLKLVRRELQQLLQSELKFPR